MADIFPVTNVRKNITGVLQPVKVVETITVPGSAPYESRLKEVPTNDSSYPLTVGGGLTKTSSYPPSSGEVYINYLSGELAFHSSQNGQSFLFTYYGKGTLIRADHINTLYNTKIEASGIPESGDIAFFDGLNTLQSGSSLDFGEF